MPGRQFVGATGYRYGFNGKESDDEVKGSGNQQDYGMRIYDPRLGKFLSVDPLTKEFPWNSTYAFAEGSPLENLDLDGLEKLNYRLIKEKSGNLKLELLSIEDKYDDGGAKFNIEYEGKHYTFEENSKYGSAYGSYSTEQMGDFFKDPNSDAWDSDEKKSDKIDSELARNAIWATATEAVNFGKGYKGARSNNTKSKTNTAKWVESNKVSPELIKKYNKLNKVDRSGKDFTKAGKKIIKDINRQVNGGNTVCVNCGTRTTNSGADRKGVKPPGTRTEIDHNERKADGGRGNPDNGDVLCRDCNQEKH